MSKLTISVFFYVGKLKSLWERKTKAETKTKPNKNSTSHLRPIKLELLEVRP